jgi:hypothetical protein
MANIRSLMTSFSAAKLSASIDWHSIKEPLATSGLKDGAAGAVGSKHREKPSHGKEGETKHSLWKRNGGTPIGHSGQIAYRGEKCSVWYRFYATIARRNMRCLVTTGKHVNSIQAIAKQPPITGVDGLLEAVFSVGSAPRLYSENSRPAEFSSVE